MYGRSSYGYTDLPGRVLPLTNARDAVFQFVGIHRLSVGPDKIPSVECLYDIRIVVLSCSVVRTEYGETRMIHTEIPVLRTEVGLKDN